MKKHHSSMEPGRRVFPGEGPTKAQRDEDVFMRTHGGWGTRLIYQVVQVCDFGRKGR